MPHESGQMYYKTNVSILGCKISVSVLGCIEVGIRKSNNESNWERDVRVLNSNLCSNFKLMPRLRSQA